MLAETFSQSEGKGVGFFVFFCCVNCHLATRRGRGRSYSRDHYMTGVTFPYKKNQDRYSIGVTIFARGRFSLAIAWRSHIMVGVGDGRKIMTGESLSF